MKKIILLTAMLCCITAARAQTYSIDYRQGSSYDMARLVFNDSLCYCYDYYWYDIHRRQKTLGNRYIRADLFYNRNNDQLCWHIEITRKRDYLVIDSTRYNWVYVAEAKTIKGYECLAAYSVDKPGDTTFAFYSKELHYPFGPFGLIGLPGVVLELYDSYRGTYWIAETIKPIDAVIILAERAKVVSWGEYAKKEGF